MKLIEANVIALDQAREVLSDLDDRVWVQAAPHTNGLRIGAHMRHVIEFYQCFFDGLAKGCIDYAARRRNATIGRNRTAALAVLDEISQRLAGIDAGGSVQVQVEGRMCARSTVARELQALLDHTIHHFALIAVGLHAFGIRVNPDFGVAPSTLRYRAISKAA